jgi:site-specific recombinase XerD
MDPLRLSLLDLHERHARHMRTLNKSEKTIDWYRGAIEDFCRFLEEAYAVAPPARLSDFALEHVRDYILYLRGRPAFAGHPFVAPRERPLSDASVNCYVRGLRGFASWLYEQEYTDVNLLGRLKAPKMTKKTVDILSDEEIERILTRLKTPTATNVRNRAIFLTLLDTGIRASELLSLTLTRAHLDEGYLLVLGKGKKERPVKIGQTAAQAIRLYVARYRPEPARPTIQEVFLTEGYRVARAAPPDERQAGEVGEGGAEPTAADPDLAADAHMEEEVIFSEPGWPLTENALKLLFTRLGKHSGVRRLHPHLLRHTYACRYLLAHRDPIALKTMLGHTTLTMTNHYVQAVEGMQVIRSDRVSVVDAMELNVGRLRRGNPRGRARPSA